MFLHDAGSEMRMFVRTGSLLTIPSLFAWALVAGQAAPGAEKTSELSARQLFFVAKPVAKPTTPPAKAAPPRKSVPKAPEVASEPAATPRLGLRYSILQPRDGKLEDVAVDKEFRSREHFGVSLRSNEDAFLYVVVQGSAGNWDVLFPYPGERNRVVAGQDVLIPPPCAANRLASCLPRRSDS